MLRNHPRIRLRYNPGFEHLSSIETLSLSYDRSATEADMPLAAAALIRNHSKTSRGLLTLFALLLANHPANSQSQSAAQPVQPQIATIHGSVIDASGAVVPGATLTLEGEQGIVLQGLSDEEGNFTMEAQPSEYVLRASSLGFSTYKQPVHLVETISIRIALQIDQQSGVCSPCVEQPEIKLLDAVLTSTLPFEPFPPFKLRAKNLKKLKHRTSVQSSANL